MRLFQITPVGEPSADVGQLESVANGLHKQNPDSFYIIADDMEQMRAICYAVSQMDDLRDMSAVAARVKTAIASGKLTAADIAAALRCPDGPLSHLGELLAVRENQNEQTADENQRAAAASAFAGFGPNSDDSDESPEPGGPFDDTRPLAYPEPLEPRPAGGQFCG